MSWGSITLPDSCILHVFCQSGRIALGLLEDALHDGILENSHNLPHPVSTDRYISLSHSTHIRVPLYPFRSLILRLAFPSHKLCLQSLLLLLLDLAVIGPSLVVFESFGAHIQALVVFLHCEVSLRFPQICSDEFRVAFDGLVAICYGSGEGHQFDQSCCTVGVAAWVVWSTLGHFGVCFDGSGPIRFLELLIPKLTRLVGLFGIDIGIFLCNYLGLLGRAEFVQNVRSAVLGQGLLVVYDGISEIS